MTDLTSNLEAGTLVLCGTKNPVLAYANRYGGLTSYDRERRLPSRGRLRLAEPGAVTEPREAAEWVRALGRPVNRFLVHTTWKRFLKDLQESGHAPTILDEEGQPYQGLPRADTRLCLRAPVLTDRVEKWQIFDPFARSFEPVGVPSTPTAAALFHERLSRELLTPGPVLVVLEGRPEEHNSRHRSVSPDALRLARALLGAYARRRRGVVQELAGANLAGWESEVDHGAIHLVVLEPTVPTMRDAAARLRATRMRWGCVLREHVPTANKEWAQWLRLLSGRPYSGPGPDLSTPDHALVTECLARLHQAEIVASCRAPEARAGGRESEEHLACKAAVYHALTAAYGKKAVEVEVDPSTQASGEDVEDEITDDEIDRVFNVEDGYEHPVIDGLVTRLDIVARPAGRPSIAVEVETCRGTIGQDPFSNVLRRLVRKADVLNGFGRTMLVAPPELAALAPRPFHRIAMSLSERIPKLGIATLDLGDGRFLDLVRSEIPDESDDPIAPEDSYAAVSHAEETPLRWSDIAGYDEVKQLIRRDVQDSFARADELRSHGLGLPSGVLLFGPPGTGKTRIARALATELGHKARLLRPSDVISKWLGEGVERIRELADWAIRERPAVLVVDELDAIAPNRAIEGNIHQDSLAMVNELLTQLDRLREVSDVLVVATTNAMVRLDPAIMRTGRFDLKIPLGPPNPEDRRAILRHYIGRQDLRVDESALNRWVAATNLLTASDLHNLTDRVGRRRILSAPPASAFSALMDEELASSSAVDRESLDRFLDDLLRYASAHWHQQYAWVGEDLKQIEAKR